VLETLRGLDRHYDDDFGTNRLFETLRLFARTHEDGRVLDVGCWPGDLAVALQRMGVDVHGLDIDPRRAMERYAQERIHVERCDIERDRFPFGDGEFRYIVFTEVIEHLYVNPLHTLGELRRILAPGGRLLLSTPNLGRWENRVLFGLGRPLMLQDSPLEAFSKQITVGHMGHLRLFMPAELLELLAHARFGVLQEHFVDLEGPSALRSGRDSTDRKPGALARLFKRRRASDYVEFVGMRVGPMIKRRLPHLRGHLFMLLEAR